MFTIFLAYLPLFFHTWPPWNSSSPVPPSVGQWPLPAQLQLPTQQDTSLGVLVGTSEQGGGLGRKQDRGCWVFGRVKGHLAAAWQEQGAGPVER